MGGLGTTRILEVIVLAWDSNKESKSGNLFSITIASGTSVASWFSLTRAAARRELDASSSVSSLLYKTSKSSSQTRLSVLSSEVLSSDSVSASSSEDVISSTIG